MLVTSDDLLVVGLDLVSGQAVYADDAPYEYWFAKGSRGDETLVCLYCYNGWESQPPARVPLVIKGQEGGLRRRHFAHPPYLTPRGGHGPETTWHVHGKLLLAQWAETQPNVGAVRVEWCTDDRSRRADVKVSLVDGTRVALELQYRRLTDGDWLDRHRDYAAKGIVDVWLWRRRLRRPGILLTHGVPIWYLDVDSCRLGTPLGKPHERPADWHDAPDLRYFGLHYPPCLEDEVSIHWTLLGDTSIGRHGFDQPASVREEMRLQIASVREEAVARAEAITEANRLNERLARDVAASPLSPDRPPRPSPPPAPVPPNRAAATKAARPEAVRPNLAWKRRVWTCTRCGNRTGLLVCPTCSPSRPRY